MKIRENIQRVAVVLSEIQFLMLWRKFLVAVITFVALCSLTSAIAATYDYDGNGRLRSATNTSGDTAHYDYDDRGNLLRITRISTQPGISSFVPNNGPSGIQVLIKGTGFASTTVDNDVRFNGTVAPVLTAAANQLLVMVPQNATTGKISVTVSGTTVVSADDFQVSQVGVPPTITSFSPTAGAMGITVTVNGTNLNPYPGASTFEINGIYVPTTYIDDVQATIVIPPYAGTGLLTITTPFGKAVSSGPFYVVPLGIDASTVSFHPLLALNASPQAVALTASLPNSAYYFNASEADYLSVQTSSFSSTSSFTYSVLSPTQSVVATGTISSASPTVHLPKLRSAGAYSIYFSGGTSAPQFSFVIERNQVIAIDTADITVSTSTMGQTKRLIFSTAQPFTLRFGGITTAPVGKTTAITIYNPDSSQLSTWAGTGAAISFNLSPAQTGTYNVVINPGGNATITLQLAMASNPVIPIAIDDPAYPVTTAISGQNKYFNFSANQGDNVALGLLDIVATGNGSMVVYVYRPDGVALVSNSICSASTGCKWTLNNLPMSGTYSFIIAVSSAAQTASYSVQLVRSVEAALAIDGGAVSMPIPRVGQSGWFRFENTVANQPVTLRIGDMIAGKTTAIYVYYPNGTLLTSWSGTSAVVAFDLKLTQTGTYSVWVNPQSFTTTMTPQAVVISNPVIAIGIDDPAYPVTTAVSGQNKYFSFSANQGDNIALGLLDLVTTGGSSMVAYVYRPDGVALVSNSSCSASTGCKWTLNNLPMSGTYSFIIAVSSAAQTSSYSVQLVRSVEAALAIDGGAVSMPIPRVGQSGWFRFENTVANQPVTLRIGDMIAGKTTAIYVYNPNGTLLTSWSGTVAVITFQLSLAQTGTYSVWVNPQSFTTTMTPQATVVTNPVIPVAIDGAVLSSTAAVSGQNKSFSFSANQGDNLALGIVDLAATGNGSVNVYVYRPDGTALISASNCPISVGCKWSLSNLSMSGTYIIIVAATSAAQTYSFSLLLSSDITGTLTSNNSVHVDIARRGQNARLTFAGTAATSTTIRITPNGMQSTFAQPVAVTIYKPDGSSLASASITAQYTFTLTSLPTTGTYTVLIKPSYAITADMNVIRDPFL